MFVKKQLDGRRHMWGVLGLALFLAIVSAVPVLAAEEGGVVGPPNRAQVAAGMAKIEAKEAERKRELQSPAAVAERESSRTRYRALAPGEARELLLSTFTEQLAAVNADPRRFLSDAQLESTSSEFAATVGIGGEGSLLESNVPVRAENEDGDLKKVNLDLELTAGSNEVDSATSELGRLAQDSPMDGTHREADAERNQSPGIIGANQPVYREGTRGIIVRPASWRPYVSGSNLYLGISVTWCPGGPKPSIDRVARLDRGDKVVLTLYIAYPWPNRSGGEKVCPGVVMGLEEPVALDSLDGASVYDGASWPPIRRWPR